MTDTTFTPPAGESSEGSQRKGLVLVGGAVGLLVLAGAGWFLLHGGSNGNTDYSLPPHKVPAVMQQPTKATAAKTMQKSSVPATSKLPPASSVKIGRDPFAALYVTPVAPVAAPSTAPSTSPSTPGTTTSATDTASNVRYTIVLTKVASDPGGAKLYTFKIGTASKTVLAAQRFGKYGELVVLTYVKSSKGSVIGAVLQVGDDNPIQIPVGVKVSVQ
jgi:hypothetical protein